MTLRDHSDPSQNAQTAAWEAAEKGLVNENVLKMAKLLGLRSVPPMSPTLGYLEQLLMRYGPLWTNGKEHIVVIGGIDVAASKLLVFDPWPPNQGKKEWRSVAGWYIGQDPVAPSDPDSSRDTGPGVAATFLYHP